MQIHNRIIEKYPFILDGGLSNVLEEQGCDLNHKLWTASLLEKNPEAIIQAHLKYLKSGAQCITTSSYQASIPGLIEVGYSRNTAEALILKSIKLAEIAIKRAMDSGIVNGKPLIAASVGPYGAYLADGSEYRGNYGASDETLRAFHLDKIKLLDRSNADFIACETIPSFQEAKVLSDIINHVDKLVWISFSCSDEQHLHDGSEIKNCVSLFENHPKVFAIGVNCTDPKYISEIIKNIKASAGDKRIIVYPNSGEAYNAKSKTWMGLSKPKFFEEMTKEWSNLGADIIGGCCRIGPEHISRMSKILLKNK
ncbi:MAG: homocysteine S-methyltransferase [Eudoraea sp.]|nr:homocysteine S-methyltransferase [Eudoraea sp.]MBT8302663.1 homocysteine S-methyltransferase [Maribacter sp.]